MQRRLLGKRGGLARKDSSKVADRRVASDGTLQRPSDLGVGTERFARRPRSLAVGATTELERLQRRSLFALYTRLFADERLPVLVYASIASSMQLYAEEFRTGAIAGDNY